MGNQYWSAFLRYCAGRSNRGAVRVLDGVEAAWVNSALLINNATYLSSPVADEGDLHARIGAAAADASAHPWPWALFLNSSYLNGIDPAKAADDAGLAHFLDVQVMTGDTAALAAPARAAAALEYRRIATREDARIALDINMRAYGLPPEMTESVMETGAYFTNPSIEFGFLACAGGVPVSTATVIEIEGWLYVALVATDPAHRQKGYAEAVMRHALQAASAALGFTRTTLDASAMGAPIYERMGYRFTGESWSMFAPKH